MYFRKLLCSAMSFVMAVSLLTACGSNGRTDSTDTADSSVSVTESSASETISDENAQAAEKLLADLKSSYRELWPVILADDYKQLWLDDSAKLVGEENAEAAFEKMSSMVTGTVIGEEAVEKYADGNELFRHTYHQNKILRLHISLMIAI